MNFPTAHEILYQINELESKAHAAARNGDITALRDAKYEAEVLFGTAVFLKRNGIISPEDLRDIQADLSYRMNVGGVWTQEDRVFWDI